LAAFIERGQTGRGKRIDISMLESMTEWMSYPLYYAFEGTSPPVRAAAAHATIYPYGPFPVGDGKTIMLGLQNEREWRAFCAQVLHQPELSSDARFDSNSQRHQHRDALRQLIVEAFVTLDIDEVIQRLEDAQIANARMNDMADVWAHPQLQARGRWVDVATPAGPVPALLPPGVSTAEQTRMDAVPSLGQHTDLILNKLGYTATQIEALRETGAI
jgi:itaconate CoA-transferase